MNVCVCVCVCVCVRGEGGGMNNSSCAPTCIDLRDRQHNKWGPRQCETARVVRNLLFQQLCGTVTVSEASAVEEYLSNKTVHPAMRAQLHLPPLDLTWPLPATRQSVQL